MRHRPALQLLLMLCGTTAIPAAAVAQGPPTESTRVQSVVDTALAAISRSDWVAFADLMIDEALMLPSGERYGDATYAVVTKAQIRAQLPGKRITERGYRSEVRIAGPMAVVWLPYDLYLDGNWSHCGVDTFTLLKVKGIWKIAFLAYTVEQPPACASHPDGPPTR